MVDDRFPLFASKTCLSAHDAVAVIRELATTVMMMVQRLLAIALLGIFFAKPSEACASDLGGADGQPPSGMTTIASEDKELSKTKFGNFEVVRVVEEAQSAPILHAGPPLRQSQLVFKNDTADFGFTIFDDGFSVYMQIMAGDGYEIPRCINAGSILSFSEIGFDRVMSAAIRLLKSCEMPKNFRARASAEMLAGSSHFPEAESAWRSLSQKLFGPSSRRCVKIRIDRDYSPFPLVDCVRYSE